MCPPLEILPERASRHGHVTTIDHLVLKEVREHLLAEGEGESDKVKAQGGQKRTGYTSDLINVLHDIFAARFDVSQEGRAFSDACEVV